MGHNLNFNENTGRYSFFSVQQKAWHGLGQIVSDYPTSEESIKHAGLFSTIFNMQLYMCMEQNVKLCKFLVI